MKYSRFRTKAKVYHALHNPFTEAGAAPNFRKS